MSKVYLHLLPSAHAPEATVVVKLTGGLDPSCITPASLSQVCCVLVLW